MKESACIFTVLEATLLLKEKKYCNVAKYCRMDPSLNEHVSNKLYSRSCNTSPEEAFNDMHLKKKKENSFVDIYIL